MGEGGGPLSQKYQHCSDCAQIQAGLAIHSFVHFKFIYSSNGTFIDSALVPDFELGAGDPEE